MATIMLADMLGMSKIATGTPAKLAREIVGGTMRWESNPIIAAGIGGQRGVRKGLTIVTTICEVNGIAKADWAHWFPGEVTTSVTGFWNALCEVDDGTRGQEWVLTGGQPSRLTIAWNDAPDAEVRITPEVMWALGTEQAVGTAEPVYYDATDTAIALGYGHGDIGVEIEDTDHGVIGIEFVIDLGAEPYNPATLRDADVKTFPEAINITKCEPTLNLITVEPITVHQLTDDTYTAGDIEIELDNGVAADDAIIALENMICPDFNIDWEGEGKVGFRHSFILGDTDDVWGSAVLDPT
jgi:hypothetical protein